MFVVNDEGLFIKVIFPFNIRRGDSVFIPLNDIYVKTDSSLGFGRINVTFKNTESNYDLPRNVVDAINGYR